MSIFQALIIFLAAFAAGMVNSVAGGGTLVTFPALIWIGRDPIIANATSTVALWPGSLGGMLGFRSEMAGTRRLMLLLGVPSIVGGLLGAMLLLLTPSETFAFLVPYLILFATLLFAVGEPLVRRLRPEHSKSEPSRAWWVGAAVFQFFVAVYGGYFGAGIGILMLAALGLLGLTDIHQMNGLKNYFAVCINVVASVYFVASGAINNNWSDALIMAVGAICGGYWGAGLARRMGRRRVRRAVIVIGLCMAVSLLFGR